MNLLADAKPERVYTLDARTVVFHFDLNKYPDLRRTVNLDMSKFMLAYPAVSGYTYGVSGTDLILKVVGTINPDLWKKESNFNVEQV
jgi:hypothetical protein